MDDNDSLGQTDMGPNNPISTLVREPIYVNPCSYESVTIVMRNIAHKVCIQKYGGDREWAIIQGGPENRNYLR